MTGLHEGKTRQVGHVEVSLDEKGGVTGARLVGNVLHLTADRAEVRHQLEGGALDYTPGPEQLYGHVSTDAIIKANPDCYYYDDRLGHLVLRSLGGGGFIQAGEVRKGGYGLLRAGEGWGEGSSREVAALALLYAGIGCVYAPSIAPIHRQNLINNGMFPLTDEAIAARFAAGEFLTIHELTAGFDDLSRRVAMRGGLFPFMEARAAGQEPESPISTPARPMTIAEKIMASHMSTQHGVVKAGDAGFLRVDVGFSHDYTTAPAAAQVRASLGRSPRVREPQNIHTFPDHLTLASALPGITAEALEGIRDLREGQRRLAEETGIHFHGTNTGGSRGICHTIVREEIALPGQVVLGTDSHTCSAGALNCLAYGIGNTEIASIWEWAEVAGKVPRSVRIELTGALSPSSTAKDVILELAALNKREGVFTGKVMEFGGPSLASLSLEEQAVLSNMAAECNALTAIMQPTPEMLNYLESRRPFNRAELESRCVYPDAGAVYDRVILLDLSTIQPLVARPGHPGNGVPLPEVRGQRVDIAYAGSCTAGDIESIGMYTRVLAGRQVTIPTWIQYGSERVRDESIQRGWHAALVAAGVQMITEPGCGACLNAGPGGPQRGQSAISATNRNMPGRMGDGDAWLANPLVVAASAVKGVICGIEDL